MRSALIPTFFMVMSLTFAPALAAGEVEANGGKPEPGTTVEMPFLIAPMSLDGKLLGYAYITSKMVCSSGDAAIKVRQKLAFIQDGFVREVNGKSIAQSADPRAVDKPQLNARLTAVARRLVGDNKVVSMFFIDIKFNPLRPSQSTGDGQVPPDQAAPQKPAGDTAAAAGTGAEASNPSKEAPAPSENAQKSRPK